MENRNICDVSRQCRCDLLLRSTSATSKSRRTFDKLKLDKQSSATPSKHFEAYRTLLHHVILGLPSCNDTSSNPCFKHSG
ncbi:hypothetical protein ASPCADRAFT_210526 [Aspergillus carbonarius ITEM 5010]|uniref:Uncharacterized protein n=1 Tax=Aspergillus carbonarius (strain ITEM 5010) TaxID=602072 RepID=A0A1R3RCB8_ASPC5|nr:hypothetical protein ASPCADRAFT_210526 [Aspergillus carbonarius ITEM 5010]